jgi:hypothetical protein
MQLLNETEDEIYNKNYISALNWLSYKAEIDRIKTKQMKNAK